VDSAGRRRSHPVLSPDRQLHFAPGGIHGGDRLAVSDSQVGGRAAPGILGGHAVLGQPVVMVRGGVGLFEWGGHRLLPAHHGAAHLGGPGAHAPLGAAGRGHGAGGAGLRRSALGGAGAPPPALLCRLDARMAPNPHPAVLLGLVPLVRCRVRGADLGPGRRQLLPGWPLLFLRSFGLGLLAAGEFESAVVPGPVGG
jgi:hypothetical protein